MIYEDLLTENGSLQIDTLLRFEGETDVFAFLYLAGQKNCTIIFENEGITVKPKGKDPKTTMSILIYNMLYNNPEFVKNYYNGLVILK